MTFFAKTLAKVVFLFTSSLASGFNQEGLESSKYPNTSFFIV